MAIQPTEGRNIVNYARKIVAEKLIMERRQWELMRDNKTHQDVVELGRMNIASYRGLMIGVTAVDLLDVNASTLSTKLINMTDTQICLLNSLSRYLILELTHEQFDNLTEHLATSIVFWTFGSSGSSEIVEDVDTDDDVLSMENGAINNLLQSNIPYVVLVLLADLHHMTYVASAEQCLEILSST